jgi:acetyltransferase
MNLNNFFIPKSVAIIGASSDKSKVGYALMANLSQYTSLDSARDKSRKIFPISLDETEILGHKTYKSLDEIQDAVDFAVIAIKADFVPDIVRQCAKCGIKNIAVISAGFKEMDEHGADLEKEIAQIAKENNIALLGPNCLGSLDCHSGLNATFAPNIPRAGKITFISQSGALGTAIIDKAVEEGIGFSKFVSLGNEASLDEIDFLQFIKDDTETEFVMMYLEKISNGPKFLTLAKEITKTKPIVVIKAGRGASGQKAVMSHTGSLASDDLVMRQAFHQAGIIVADSIRQFFNIAKLFSLGIKKPLTELVILTNAGGPAVITSDLIDLSKSLSLCKIDENEKAELKKVLPPMAGLNNPIDIIGDALSPRYDSALKILKHDSYQAIIVLVTPQMMTDDDKIAEVIANHSKNKILLPVFIGGQEVQKGIEVLKQNNLVNFDFPVDVVEALDKLALNQKKALTENTIAQEHSSSGTMLSYEKTMKLLKDHGIVMKGILAKEKNDLREAMTKLGGDSFSLKVISKSVIHKTDMGAVKLHIKTLDEAEKAWDSMLASVLKIKPDADIEGMVIQPMAVGKEVIIGMKRDSTFDSTILFGLGGIFTEALKDTSFRVAPVTKEMALEMMHEIRGVNILSGLRGDKSVDFHKLANIIVSISDIAMSHPEIMEIDLNPVMAGADKTEIVDVRVMVKQF